MQLSVDPKSKEVRRQVREDASKAKALKPKSEVQEEVEEGGKPDTDLVKLEYMLRMLADKYGKTTEYIIDWYIKVSGNEDALERHLQGHSVVTWDPLEDMALKAGEGTPEFSVLLYSKGYKEIKRRRNFLVTKEEWVSMDEDIKEDPALVQ